MSYVGGMAITFKALNQKAGAAALQAAAQVVVNGLKEQKPNGLAGGYTSGEFVTGNLLNSLYITDVQTDADGQSIAVATDVEYAVYWEYGHYNIFLRRFIREERWRPTLVRKQDEAIAAYQRVYERFV